MSMPILRAASSTVVPRSTATSRPSITMLNVSTPFTSPSLCFDNGFEFAAFQTEPALDADGLVDHIRLFQLAADGIHRTAPCAQAAAAAKLRHDGERQHGPAYAGGTFL